MRDFEKLPLYMKVEYEACVGRNQGTLRDYLNRPDTDVNKWYDLCKQEFENSSEILGESARDYRHQVPHLTNWLAEWSDFGEYLGGLNRVLETPDRELTCNLAYRVWLDWIEQEFE